MRRPGRRRSIVLPRGIAVLAALAGTGALAALLATAAWRLGRAPSARESFPAARLSVAAALRAPDARGFARALAPRPFVFPADHGPHPEYRTEWWYYTGNVAARDGRRFGFQLTLFRSALAPPAPGPAPSGGRASAWATRQVWFAHFAVTDAAGHRFLAYERWERQALGLAGAESSPFRVWVGPWSATAAAGAGAGPVVAGTPPMRLFAGAGEAAIDLVLTAALPPVPQGDRGLSAKSPEPGNASYYYSLPRLAATGTLRVGAERLGVTGLAWMDREWSTSSLAADEVGWDWFALQLDDGWELMLYRLRRRPPAARPAADVLLAGAAGGRGSAAAAATVVNGTATARGPASEESRIGRGAQKAPAAADLADPASLATLIAPDGRTTRLPLSAVRFAATNAWTSPVSHARYPSGWRLTLPGAGPAAFDLIVQPLLAAQELRLSFRYWEGAVTASGTHAGRPVKARGYVELTGYGDTERPASLSPAEPASRPGLAARR